MPPHRSVRRRRRRRRRRHELSRPPFLEEDNVTERTSARVHGPIDTPGSLCAEDQAASVQKPQAASSIVTTSLSGLQSQDTTHVAPPSRFVRPRVWSRLVRDWGHIFYIRRDRQGYFHTYPGLDGPYRSSQEADEAIDRYLDKLRDPKFFGMRDGETSLDVIIRKEMHWPDGTLKRSKPCAMQRRKDQMLRLAQALVDKYNERHNLSGDLAYELKDVLSDNPFTEHESEYHHLNFSANSKATIDSDSSTSDIFFAEVKNLNLSQGEHREVIVLCLRRVDPVGKGQHCNACSILGGDVMHPDSSVELAAGDSDPRCQFGGLMDVGEWYYYEDLTEQEDALRRMYEGLDDPRTIESLFTPLPGVTVVPD